jgi:hypothetical protein
MAVRPLTNHENRPSFWFKATVTKPVWSKVIGLRRFLKTCFRRSSYAKAGQRPNRMTILASLPLPLDETYFLTNNRTIQSWLQRGRGAHGAGCCGKEQAARSSPRRIAWCDWSSGSDGVPVGLDRGVLAVDFLSSQAYKTPIMIPRDR